MRTKVTLFLLFLSCITYAGDTTTVRIHDHTDMTWYGNYDEWGKLPNDSLSYRKIYLHYTMGCASNGCSDWDYTTQIILRHRTGAIDSTLHSSPNFLVNGIAQDTVYFSSYPTTIFLWDSINNMIDSVFSDSVQIILFSDANNPTLPSDTLWVWQSNLFVFDYDSLGNITDTIYHAADSMWTAQYYNWYTYYDIIEDFELARVITPYGNSLPNNWEFTHVFDVTDFEPLLHDSVEIRCHYSGWSSGFSATLDFEYIEGTPPRTVVQTDNVYAGNYNYISSSDFEQNKLIPKDISLHQNTTMAKVRMTATGHGFDNNQSAAEFKPINYYLQTNGILTHTQYNWDADCGENPIYPQGGTWIYDRANWCPGKRAQIFEHEITPNITTNDSVNINIDFQPYSWSGTQTPSYSIACQLVQYSNANFNNSAEIVDIIKPSLKDEYSRKNPICGKPLIKIRNYGNNPLTSLEIEYNVQGGGMNTFQWTGNLDFMQSEEVELPPLSSWTGTNKIFEVRLKNPNGLTDDYSDNNYMQSAFEYVPEYPNTFALWITTNAGVINSLTQVSETSWEFLDDLDNTVFSSGTLYGNTPYKDTLSFTNGCYTFIVSDSDEDGLKFWANSDGNGLLRFRDLSAGWLKQFETDFGSNVVHQFTVGYPQSTNNQSKFENWIIFPNPTNNKVIIEGFSDNVAEIALFDNLGKKLMSTDILQAGFISKTLDLGTLSKGIYFLKITNAKNQTIKKIVKQ